MNGSTTSGATRISYGARAGQITCLALGFLFVAIGVFGAVAGSNQSVYQRSSQIELLWLCGPSERSVEPGWVDCRTIPGDLPSGDQLGANRILPAEDQYSGPLTFLLVGLAFLVASLSIVAGARREPVRSRGTPVPPQPGPGQPAYPAQWPAQPPPA